MARPRAAAAWTASCSARGWWPVHRAAAPPLAMLAARVWWREVCRTASTGSPSTTTTRRVRPCEWAMCCWKRKGVSWVRLPATSRSRWGSGARKTRVPLAPLTDFTTHGVARWGLRTTPSRGGGGVGEGVGDGESGQGEFLELPDLVAALQLGVEAVDQRAAHPFEVAQQGDFAVGVHGAGDLAYADHFGCGQVGAAQGVQGQPAVADAKRSSSVCHRAKRGPWAAASAVASSWVERRRTAGVLADQHPDAGAVRGGRLGGGAGRSRWLPRRTGVRLFLEGRPPSGRGGSAVVGGVVRVAGPVVRSSCRGDGPSRISMPARR